MFKKNKNKNSGYTLIETMIALAIFLIVVTIGSGSLINAYSVNRKSQDLRSGIDGLSFAIEDMSRNIRTGYNYHCIVAGDLSLITDTKSCIDGGDGIAFESSEGDESISEDQWAYFIFDGKLFKTTTGDLNPLNAVQMTPSEVVLSETTKNFVVFGAEKTDKQQPFVIIRLVGKITSRGQVTSFSLQTMISQRKSDI
ncbi:MAG: type II secretion system protein [bacterium]